MRSFLLLSLLSFSLLSFGQKEKQVSLCDCINMDQDELTKECQEVKQIWKERFEAADNYTKSVMVEEYQDCKRLAKMESNPSLCLCVSIDPALWNKACKKIKTNWDKAYRKADGEKKKDMKQEILDCNTDKKVEEKPKNKLEDVSDENFCDCMDYYGGKLALSMADKPNQKKIEQFDKINKSDKNRCLFAMRDINIGELEVIDRASECSDLQKYFADTTHIYSVQKKATDGIYKILDKYNNSIEVCSCIEIMKLEKEILSEEHSPNINRRQSIQMVFEKPRQLCASLVRNLSDEELKEFEEKAKNCK